MKIDFLFLIIVIIFALLAYELTFVVLKNGVLGFILFCLCLLAPYFVDKIFLKRR
ncbi:MAG: hypothetical protein QXI58_00665 [Candidatus Micrarchaeia archaeon]